MMKRVLFFIFVSLLFVFVPQLHSQSNNADMVSSQFDTTGFPQWAKDLRRAEIVAFGSFPFMYFFSNFGVGCWRWNRENGMSFSPDGRQYAPWPFDSAGYVEKTSSEKMLTIGIAAGASVLIAVIDYGIVRYKRNRQIKASMELPPGTPIIIQRSLYEEEDTAPLEETELPSSPESEFPPLPEEVIP